MTRLARYVWWCVVVLVVTTGCGSLLPATRRSPTVKLNDLLVGLAVFPSVWRVETQAHKYEIREGQADGRFSQFRARQSQALANHIVLQYKNEPTAEWHYGRQEPSEFGRAERLTPWAPLSTRSYVSPLADQFRLACAEFRLDYEDESKRATICKAMARYDEFISIFGTWMSPDFMTEEELVRILEAIDRRMAIYVKGKSQEEQ